MSRTLWSVSIRSRLEVRFEDRLQDELERTLNHAVADRGNRKNADLLAPVLRYFLLPRRHGSIRVVDQFVPDLFQKILRSAFLDGFERNPIDSWGSVVALSHLVGFLKRFHLADVDVQSPEAPGWFSLRLRSCKLTGAFIIHPCLPFVGVIANSRASSLHGRYAASLLLLAPPPPSRLSTDFLVLPVIRLPCFRRFLVRDE